jgi:hypothetical protein
MMTLKNGFNDALQKAIKESEDRHQEALSTMKDHAEESQSKHGNNKDSRKANWSSGEQMTN